MNNKLCITLGGGVTLVAYQNTGDGDGFKEIAVDALVNGTRTPIALVGRSCSDEPGVIHTYSYTDDEEEPVWTFTHVGWRPVKYDPDNAKKYDCGTYYDGHDIFTIRDYDDEDVDYDNGYIGCLAMFVDPVSGEMYGDGLWTGYHSTNECMEDEWHTDNVYRIYDDGFDVCSLSDLEHCLKDVGIDLKQAMQAIDELL